MCIEKNMYIYIYLLRLLRLKNLAMCHPDKGRTGLCSEWSKRELTQNFPLLSSAAFSQQHHSAWTMPSLEKQPWLRGTGSTAACVVKRPLVCSLRDIVVILKYV